MANLYLMYGEGFDGRMVKACREHLQDNLISVFYGGTAATDDTIEGWSDFDVVFVVDEVTSETRDKAGVIGKKLGVGDEFKIHYMTREELMDYGPVWLLLDKYHAEWPYGEQLRDEIEVPEDEVLRERLLDLNDGFRDEFLKYEQNFPFCSLERRKEKLYYVLKRMIHPVYCTHHYLKTGEFKGGRDELKKTGNADARHIIETLQNWKDYTPEDWQEEKEAVLGLNETVEEENS